MQEEIKTRVVCDRCKRVVEGMEMVVDGQILLGTGGYYKRGYRKYMTDSEGIVCDECMWKDQNFRKDYPTSPVVDGCHR